MTASGINAGKGRGMVTSMLARAAKIGGRSSRREAKLPQHAIGAARPPPRAATVVDSRPDREEGPDGLYLLARDASTRLYGKHRWRPSCRAARGGAQRRAREADPVAVRVVARRVLDSIPAGRTRRIRAAQVRFVGDSLAS